MTRPDPSIIVQSSIIAGRSQRKVIDELMAAGWTQAEARRLFDAHAFQRNKAGRDAKRTATFVGWLLILSAVPPIWGIAAGWDLSLARGTGFALLNFVMGCSILAVGEF